jgi:hypothetical protein
VLSAMISISRAVSYGTIDRLIRATTGLSAPGFKPLVARFDRYFRRRGGFDTSEALRGIIRQPRL